MNDTHSAYPYIADLVEAPHPRDTLSALAKDLTEIKRMVAKARALLRSANLSQAEAHGIFIKLSGRMAFKEYALASLKAVADQKGLPASLAMTIQPLQTRTERVDAALQEALLDCYVRISKSPCEVAPFDARKALNLAELAAQLQDASLRLANILFSVNFVAKLDPLPITMADIEKARADIRHDRTETALAAAQLAPSPHASKNPETTSQRIAAEAALSSIANTLDALEIAFKTMEDRLAQPRIPSATVH